ncbi:Gamma-glutamylcyclotransferase [Lachnellula suecica]|uniref:gamma-glutamylcyclotransferase n=1 Tax=Lachnellula suecica TaxID=602035 RepID=A0A8T9CLW3_9HELO|nr:Gamma-glutamylcyclotransferase [Lachnellula suecica]
MAHSPGQVAVQTVYFAYGSNLHLTQMAQRCPESRYLGRGRLLDFKWQINNRGYANIYHSPGDQVEGLCFLLSQNDERRLDVNEGVASGAYAKHYVPVQVYAATATIAGRRVREVNETISQALPYNQQSVATMPTDTSEQVKSLVYISFSHRNDGLPRPEYVTRMSNGIIDARRLGVPTTYFENCMRGPLGM